MSPRLALVWLGMVGAGALGGVWPEGLAMASTGGFLLAWISWTVLRARTQPEELRGPWRSVYVAATAAATIGALLGTFAATKLAIGEGNRAHTIEYGIVCGATLVVAYRALIKRTPASVALLAVVSQWSGFAVMLEIFFRVSGNWDGITLDTTLPALAMYAVLGASAVATAAALAGFAGPSSAVPEARQL